MNCLSLYLLILKNDNILGQIEKNIVYLHVNKRQLVIISYERTKYNSKTPGHSLRHDELRGNSRRQLLLCR